MAGTPEVEGVKEAIKALRKIDPEMRKAFNTNVRMITKQMTDAMKSNYDDIRFPSGTKRKWSQDGAQKFPLTASRARNGVRVKIDTSRKASTAISVRQSNAAAVIFDIAGAKTNNKLARAFDTTFGRRSSRVMWPEAEAHIDDVRNNLVELLEQIEQDISREVER
jgi:hypothetical protein